jgi:outer membrane protein assembly factor BamB
MHSRHTRLAILGLNLLLLFPTLALLSPTGRRALVDKSLSANLHLHWVRDLPPLEPTWPDQPRFTSDTAPRPVVAGSLVLLTSSRSDDLTALDVATGQLRWRFATDGPIRFAPAVWDERIYVASDDGYLYCLDTEGNLAWKFRGGPAHRRILGNERLVSSWPARGAPAVAVEADGDATVYFAAGIWPFMGIFLHALDARTGAVRWTNSGDGSTFIRQPHQADAFAGVAPQGSLVVVGDRLLVPGGRSIPACYDRHTGKRLHYRLADSSKLGGGPDVVAGSELYVNGGGAFDLVSGQHLGALSEPVAIHETMMYSASGTACRAYDLLARPATPGPEGGLKAKALAKVLAMGERWLGSPAASVAMPRATTLLHAGKRLYGGGEHVVFALDLPFVKGKPALAWQTAIEGTAIHLAVTDDHLFVTTREGRLYAFGSKRIAPRRYKIETTPLPRSTSSVVRQVVQATSVLDGYCVVFGIGSGELITGLLASTDLRILVIEPDAQRVEAFREALHAAGLPGKRVAVLNATPATAELPPYLCSLIVAEDLGAANVEADGAFFDLVFRSLRPYGGVACLPLVERHRSALNRWVATASADGQARVSKMDGLILLSRPGAPPGSANWTHEHADAANTRVSRDKLVKAPLGVLWFGGPAHHGILPRHGHGPVPQVVDGRLVIEGVDGLRAVDVYTGRLLWEARLPGLGRSYDNLAHQPGANAAGSNYVSTSTGIYVALKSECLRLDPANGQTLQRFSLPALRGEKKPPEWSYVSVSGQYLVGGANPAKKSAPKKGKLVVQGSEASKYLFVLDRVTGKLLWQAAANGGFRHNTICTGNGRLFAIDRPPVETRPRKADKTALDTRLFAFDLATGNTIWSTRKEVFGTWASYSEAHDVLVEAGLMSRDTAWDEAPGMRVYDGKHGKVLWYRKDYYGPALIHGDRILKSGDPRAGSGTACELRTGEPIRESDPLTGRPIEWRWLRTYGCNTPAASENLVLFRSGAAGYFDLCSGGTGNLGGFRSSCTFNLIAAGGVLSVPDYTRTCTCSYQQQTSLGLIHVPDAEMWTFTTSRKIDGPIRRLGLLLGAPGSRKADNGTLWLEYPPVGGPSPRLTVTTVPSRLDTFRMHASQVEGGGPKWVAASGARGIERLTISLDTTTKERAYTVRLYFVEPDRLPDGQRKFDVAIGDECVLHALDISQETGGPGRLLMREVKGVRVRHDLTIDLTPVADVAVPVSVLCGVEVMAEGW